jgi:ADP-heptose:LPS heptosyltransferase
MFLKFINKVIAFFRKLLKKKNNKQEIAILSFKFLGDTVFTIPAIDLIRKNYPDHEITIFCYPESRAIYELYFKNINYECYGKKDLDLDSRKFNFRIFGGIKRIRDLNFEMIFDFTILYKSAIICLFSGASVSVGFGNKLLEGFYDYFSPKKRNCHLMDMFVSSLEKILPEGFSAEKEFPVNLKKVNRILLNPLAGWGAKEWNYDKYLILAARLKIDYYVEFIAEKGYLPSDLIEKINELNLKLILSDKIEELFEAVRNNDLIISNDTGIIYIASLLGKSTFTIYGPTNPEYSLPFGKYHRFVQKKIECSPKKGEQYCYLEAGKKCPLYECMNRLSVEEVYEGLNIFINEINKIENWAAS